MNAVATRIDRLTNRLPDDLVERTRSLFLALGLLTAVLAVPPLLFGRRDNLALDLAAVSLLGLLCWRWVAWFERGVLADYDPFIEVLALTALTWALSNPTIGLGVFYVGLYYRSLFGNRRQAILGVVTFTASFFTGVALHADNTTSLLSSTAMVQVPGFVLTGSVMYVIGRTLTTHRETTEQLSFAEQRFRTLVEQLPVGVYQAELDGRVTYVSPRARSIFGYEADAVRTDVDWTIHTLIHPDDRESVMAARDLGAVETVQTDIEFRMMDVNNEQRWVRVRSSLVHGVCGRSDFWQGTIEDVTDHKAAESAIHTAEERYRTLVEQLPAVTYVSSHDDSGTPSYVSPQ
ncbi:MAG: PAS domain S-box protein, partial [Nitrolancea sp.]